MSKIETLAEEVVNRKGNKAFVKRDIAAEVTTKAHAARLLPKATSPEELLVQRAGVQRLVTNVLHRRDAQERRIYLSYLVGGTWFWQHTAYIPLSKLYTIRADYEERGRRLHLRRDGVQDRIDQLEAARKLLHRGHDITLAAISEAGV